MTKQIWNRFRKSNEKGQALILVLVLLLVGAIVIAPLLANIGTGLKAGEVHEEKANELYAADAGIEDGLWQIKNDNMGDLFLGYSPTYDAYDYLTDNWTYTLPEQVNSKDVNVTIKNIWIPKDLAVPDKAEARTIIETGRLVVSGNVLALPTTGNPGQYRIKITYYHQASENLIVQKIGVWLPAGFAYYTDALKKSNLEDITKDYNTIPVVSTHAGGQAVIWNFSAYPFDGTGGLDPLPAVDPAASPMECAITFYFTSTQTARSLEAVAWIETNGVSDIPYSWCGDIRVFRMTSVAGGTTIESYAIRSQLRQLAAAISGDYKAVGNSLMARSSTSIRYRNILLNESSATVSDIPQDAQVVVAYLYWSGWFEDASGGSQTSVPTADGDSNGTWEVTQTQTRVPTADGDISGTWNTAPRWDDVDEIPADDADYMTGTTDAGGYMLFTFNAFDVPAGATINDLTVFIRARDQTGGGNNIYEYIKVNGSYYPGSTSHNPWTTATSYSYSWTTNPNTGAAWTVNDINETGSNPLQQIGVNSTDLDPDMRVTQVYAQVTYTISTDRYASLDETTPDDTDYMTGTTDSGGYMLFNFSPFSIPAGAIITNLTVYVRARDVSSGTNNIRPSIKVNGTRYNTTATSINPGTSFTTYSYSYTRNPNTGLAWVVEDLYGTGASPLQQFGVYSSDLNPDIRVSMVYARVNYTLPVADTTCTFRIDGIQVYLDGGGNPQVGAQPLTADSSQVIPALDSGNPHGFSYASKKDVTKLVTSFSAKAPDPATNHPGNAQYTVGDVDATWDARDEWAYAGWSLVIIYASAQTRGHQLYLYDTLLFKDHNDEFLDFDQDGTEGGIISGFLVPDPVAGEVNAAKITCFVGEGDDWYEGDYFMFNGTKLDDGTSSLNDVWNGRSIGMSAEGVDVDTFYITWASRLLLPGDTSAQIDMWTDTDVWNLVYIILSFRSAAVTGGTVTYLIIQ